MSVGRPRGRESLTCRRSKPMRCKIRRPDSRTRIWRSSERYSSSATSPVNTVIGGAGSGFRNGGSQSSLSGSSTARGCATTVDKRGSRFSPSTQSQRRPQPRRSQPLSIWSTVCEIASGQSPPPRPSGPSVWEDDTLIVLVGQLGRAEWMTFRSRLRDPMHSVSNINSQRPAISVSIRAPA